MIENNKKKKIIITGGGTLGHILPILPVVYEIYEDELTAIAREKYLKRCYRNTKNKLIGMKNPHWNDLYEQII